MQIIGHSSNNSKLIMIVNNMDKVKDCQYLFLAHGILLGNDCREEGTILTHEYNTIKFKTLNFKHKNMLLFLLAQKEIGQAHIENFPEF